MSCLRKKRNEVVREIKKAKDNYFRDYFLKYRNSIAKTWEDIRTLVNLKNTNKSSISSLMVEGKIITEKSIIVKAFNDFFTNIGPHMAKNIPSTNKKFPEFIREIVSQTFFISPTDTTEVTSIVNSLKSGKSVGPNSIPVRILKNNIDILSKPLTKVINLSFNEGTFPNLCKIARVIQIKRYQMSQYFLITTD